MAQTYLGVRSLIISDCDCPRRDLPFSALTNMLRFFRPHKITDLRVSHNPAATDEWLRTACSQWPLEHLHIAGCKNITPHGLKMALQSCMHLQSLDISGLPSILQHTARTVTIEFLPPTLTALYVAGLPIARNVAELLSSLTQLQTLDLSCCLVVDGGVTRLLQNCGSNLRQLNLSCVTSLTAQDIATLAVCCPRLEQLDLSGCVVSSQQQQQSQQIPEQAQALQAVLQQCKQFRVLVLSASNYGQFARATFTGVVCSLEKVSFATLGRLLCDDAVDALSAACPRLQSLSLASCMALSDFALTALTACPDLCELTLTSCLKLTDAGVCDLLTHCKKLRVLSLVSCRVGHAVLAAALSRPQPLDQLDLTATYVQAVRNSESYDAVVALRRRGTAVTLLRTQMATDERTIATQTDAVPNEEIVLATELAAVDSVAAVQEFLMDRIAATAVASAASAAATAAAIAAAASEEEPRRQTRRHTCVLL